jgi:hypothetical protein
VSSMDDRWIRVQHQNLPDMNLFTRADWSYLPSDGETLQEELPADMPKPLGKSMTMRVFFDSDHTGDMLTH